MKTNLLNEHGVIQGLGRLSKMLMVAGVAAIMTITQADAREHHRGRDHGRGFDRRGPERVYYRPDYRRDYHRPSRGWSRPGYYGAYPPLGYVDYRYIRSLPYGYRSVYRGGSRYYYANGQYYWPSYYNENRVFLSVRF